MSPIFLYLYLLFVVYEFASVPVIFFRYRTCIRLPLSVPISALSLVEMEEKIVAVAEYTKFCALNYDFNTNDPVCIRQDSVVNYFDPSE